MYSTKRTYLWSKFRLRTGQSKSIRFGLKRAPVTEQTAKVCEQREESHSRTTLNNKPAIFKTHAVEKNATGSQKREANSVDEKQIERINLLH